MLSLVGGVSKLYEAQERAVLNEYHDVLMKLVNRAAEKEKDAHHHQQQGMPRSSRDPSSRPLSAPAIMPDTPQHPMNGSANQGQLQTHV